MRAIAIVDMSKVSLGESFSSRAPARSKAQRAWRRRVVVLKDSAAPHEAPTGLADAGTLRIEVLRFVLFPLILVPADCR